MRVKFAEQITEKFAAIILKFTRPKYLVTRPKYPPTPIARQVLQYPCRTVFPVVSQTITPTVFLKKGLSQSKDSLSKRWVSQKKLASEAYRAAAGVARNSIANRAFVGHFLDLLSLVFWFSLVFPNQENSLVFWVFSTVFLCFSRGFSGFQRSKNPWCFGWFSLVFT